MHDGSSVMIFQLLEDIEKKKLKTRSAAAACARIDTEVLNARHSR